MNPNIDVYATDFGVVRLEKAVRYMDKLDANWREIVANKRKRGRHARYLRTCLKNVETTVNTLAWIEWIDGDVLTTL